jgi:hypothetical protein
MQIADFARFLVALEENTNILSWNFRRKCRDNLLKALSSKIKRGKSANLHEVQHFILELAAEVPR